MILVCVDFRNSFLPMHLAPREAMIMNIQTRKTEKQSLLVETFSRLRLESEDE